jgi:hypothetical protein
MKAVQLFDEARGLSPKDQAGYISARLPEALADGPLSVWGSGEPIPAVGRRTLLGVAPYSRPDLELLDAISEALQQADRSEEKVQIFDISRCASMEDLNEFIPGIGRVYQTPVVGIWRDGVLLQKASGAQARQIVLQQYSLGK